MKDSKAEILKTEKVFSKRNDIDVLVQLVQLNPEKRIDIREWIANGKKPTKKGISVPVNELENLIEVLKKFVETKK